MEVTLTYCEHSMISKIMNESTALPLDCLLIIQSFLDQASQITLAYTYQEIPRFDNYPKDFSVHAAAIGSIKLLQWAIDRNWIIDDRTVISAIDNRQINVLDFLIHKVNETNTGIFNIMDLSKNVGRYGDSTICQWIIEKQLFNNLSCMYGLCETGNEELYDWLISKGYETSYNSPSIVALNGHLHLLRKISLNHALTESLFVQASIGNHVHIMEWLKYKRCPISPSTISSVSYYSTIDVLKWMYDNFNIDMFSVIIRNDLEILREILSYGCTISDNTIFNLINNSNALYYLDTVQKAGYQFNLQSLLKGISSSNIEVCVLYCRCCSYY